MKVLSAKWWSFCLNVNLLTKIYTCHLHSSRLSWSNKKNPMLHQQIDNFSNLSVIKNKPHTAVYTPMK